MSSEVLAVPDEHLAEFCRILRTGLKHHQNTTAEVQESLLLWCQDTEAYLARGADEGLDEEDPPETDMDDEIDDDDAEPDHPEGS